MDGPTLLSLHDESLGLPVVSVADTNLPHVSLQSWFACAATLILPHPFGRTQVINIKCTAGLQRVFIRMQNEMSVSHWSFTVNYSLLSAGRVLQKYSQFVVT